MRHPLTRVRLALTFSTGLVDAASYLRLGHVFAANMTGNVVLLGFGIAGAGGLPVVAPVVSLVAFLVGARLGVRLGARAAGRGPRGGHPAGRAGVRGRDALGGHRRGRRGERPRRLVSRRRRHRAAGDGHGARNAAVRSLRVPDLTTTVLTMTITALAAELPSLRNRDPGTMRRLAAVTSMLAGAIAGALLQKTSLALVLGVATAVAVLTLGAGRTTASGAPPP